MLLKGAHIVVKIGVGLMLLCGLGILLSPTVGFGLSLVLIYVLVPIVIIAQLVAEVCQKKDRKSQTFSVDSSNHSKISSTHRTARKLTVILLVVGVIVESFSSDIGITLVGLAFIPALIWYICVLKNK